MTLWGTELKMLSQCYPNAPKMPYRRYRIATLVLYTDWLLLYTANDMTLRRKRHVFRKD